MSNDPYEVLGVDKNATKDEIAKAFKGKAKKAHPDHGGSAEEFTRVKQAALVLLDPKKRKQFDEDGFTEDSKDERSVAMDRIASFFINTINAWAEGNVDLNQLDIVSGAKNHFSQQNVECQAQIRNLDRQMAKFNKAISRIKTRRSTNSIKQMLDNHTVNIKKLVAANKNQIRINRLAIDILLDYTFEKEESVAGLFFPHAKFFGL